MKITVHEAAKILKCKPYLVRLIVPVAGQSRLGVQHSRAIYNFYEVDVVKGIAEERRKLAEKNKPRISDATKHYVKKKRGGISAKDDPYGVQIKPKKGTRMCPICNKGPLNIGQYLCQECNDINPKRDKFDAKQAYGGLV